jgi:hypothetical protein
MRQVSSLLAENMLKAVLQLGKDVRLNFLADGSPELFV